MSLTEAYYRRLYAAHKPSETEEFYAANQPRDKNGRWTRSGGGSKIKTLEPTTNKIWSGVSAHPDRRTAPKSDLTFPIEKDTYENQREANFRFARGVFDTDLGDGYRSTVKQVEPNTPRGEMVVRGVITHKGREVGTFDRMITIEGKGKVAVDHTELMIDPGHRSKGLGDRFNSHAVAKYQELGVDRITLHAGDSVGGFAWARQGFRWSTPEVAKTVGHRALNLTDASVKHDPKVPDAVKQQIYKETRALRKALDAGEDVQPIHIASIGERSARTVLGDDAGYRHSSWPGKRAMMQSPWEGVYYFDANQAVTAAATDLAHAELRPQFKSEPAREPLVLDSEGAMKIEEFYNPNQPRAKDGKWSSGGGAAPSTTPAAAGGGSGGVTIDGVGDVDAYLAANPQLPDEPIFVWHGRLVNGLSPESKHDLLFEIRESPEIVPFIAEGMTRWREMKGLAEPQVEINQVKAPAFKADVVARTFEKAEDAAHDPEVQKVFAEFKRQSEEMYDFMTKPESEGGMGVKVEFWTDPNPANFGNGPYANATEQANDLRVNKRIKLESGLGGPHDATMSRDEYDRFRAVHDVFGHAGVGTGFDRHGEYQAYLAHASMYTGDGHRGMASEYHGVNTAAWAGAPGSPGTGKSVLLPDRLIDNPWRSDGTLKPVPTDAELYPYLVASAGSNAGIKHFVKRTGIKHPFAQNYDKSPYHQHAARSSALRASAQEFFAR